MIESIEFVDEGVRLFFRGIITSEELLEANNKVLQHQGFESCKYHLWIFDDVKDFIVSADEVRQFAESDRKESERNPTLKTGIVSESPLVFGIGRMYEAFYGDGPWQVMAFYQLDEAEKWLNS